MRVLAPEIAEAVLSALDSSSMKSLRATSRQCHALVSKHTTKLTMGSQGVQHFTTVPLYKVYPALTELSVGQKVPAGQLLGLLRARGLEHLDLQALDLSRCTTRWTVTGWGEFVTLLPDGLRIKLHPRCMANPVATDLVGKARCVPRYHMPRHHMPRHHMPRLGRAAERHTEVPRALRTNARDVAAALSLLARLQPASVVELEESEGASAAVVWCENQKGLDALCRCRQLVKAALGLGRVSAGTHWNFGRLGNLTNLTHLSVKLSDPGLTMALLQALTVLPQMTTLRLCRSTLYPHSLSAMAMLPALTSLLPASQLAFRPEAATPAPSSARPLATQAPPAAAPAPPQQQQRPQTAAPVRSAPHGAPPAAGLPTSVPASAAPPRPVPEPAPAARPAAVAEPGAPALAPVPVDASGLPHWETLIERSNLRGPLGLLAQNSLLRERDGNTLVLALQPAHMHLAVEPMVSQMAERIGQALGENIRLRFVGNAAHATAETPAVRAAQARDTAQSAAEESIEDDPLVQSMKREFGARVVPQSVKPFNQST
ncbi:MAG: hypothetical protein WDW36_000497 [Sanguina aurantia]